MAQEKVTREPSNAEDEAMDDDQSDRDENAKKGHEHGHDQPPVQQPPEEEQAVQDDPAADDTPVEQEPPLKDPPVGDELPTVEEVPTPTEASPEDGASIDNAQEPPQASTSGPITPEALSQLNSTSRAERTLRFVMDTPSQTKSQPGTETRSNPRTTSAHGSNGDEYLTRAVSGRSHDPRFL